MLPDFIAYWAKAYNYPNEPFYTDNIGKQPTRERVLELFVWKNGRKLSSKKKKSVEGNYVGRLTELKSCNKECSPEEWLSCFGGGGAIWDIFFLHIWQQRYPIFDQHVFRAMRFIQTGKRHELPARKQTRIKLYLEEYQPFYSSLLRQCENTTERDIDKALWKFGQFLR